MKICHSKKTITCGLWKDEKEFYVRDGKIINQCKECCNKRTRADYIKNADRNRKYASEYRVEHPEQVAKANKKWREENIEYVKEQDKHKHINNKEVRNKQSKDNYRKIKNYLNYIKETTPCYICNCYFPACAMDFDHIIPKLKMINLGNVRSITRAEAELTNCKVICANCHRIKTYGIIEYDNNYRGRIMEFVDGYKNMPCVDCKNVYNVRAMDFDHVDPNTKIECVSRLFRNGKSKQMICDEIQKCEIRCACCHRIKTFLREDEK